MSTRDRKKLCQEKIIKHFDDDTFYRFLLQKYAGHNGSGNWWKEVGLAVDRVVNAAGTTQKPSPDVVKKAFSDAIFYLDAQVGKNLDLTLAARHMIWLRKQEAPGSMSLTDYAKHRYHIGTDGMIAKMPPAPIKRRQSELDQDGVSSDDHRDKQARVPPQNTTSSSNKALSGISNALGRFPDPSLGSTSAVQESSKSHSAMLYGRATVGDGDMTTTSSRREPANDNSPRLHLPSEIIDLTRSPPPSETIDLTGSPTD